MGQDIETNAGSKNLMTWVKEIQTKTSSTPQLTVGSDLVPALNNLNTQLKLSTNPQTRNLIVEALVALCDKTHNNLVEVHGMIKTNLDSTNNITKAKNALTNYDTVFTEKNTGVSERDTAQTDLAK